jgi:hypothetical protein
VKLGRKEGRKKRRIKREGNGGRGGECMKEGEREGKKFRLSSTSQSI